MRATEDNHRQQALSIIKGLADHCSDPTEMAELIKYLFGVLGGNVHPYITPTTSQEDWPTPVLDPRFFPGRDVKVTEG